MLKNILKVGKELSRTEQQAVNGGDLRPIPIHCQVGCEGLSSGTECYASENCECPGKCGSGDCQMY